MSRLYAVPSSRCPAPNSAPNSCHNPHLSQVPYLPVDVIVSEDSFEDWAKSSHIKSVTLDVLRSNDIDDMDTVRLLNSDDIKVAL